MAYGASVCATLIVASVLFEVGGLGIVAWQLGRVQRREFGTPGWIALLRSWWLTLMGGRAVTSSATRRTGGTVASRATLTGRMRRAGIGVESRLDALERNLAALDEELDERFQLQDDRRAQVQAEVRALEVRLRRDQDAREDERLTVLRQSMIWQWIGTGVFLIGAILAGVANGAC